MAAKHNLRGSDAHYGGTLTRRFAPARRAPPGQQIGHGPGPRYLWPRVQDFQPPLRVAMSASDRRNGQDGHPDPCQHPDASPHP